MHLRLFSVSFTYRGTLGKYSNLSESIGDQNFPMLHLQIVQSLVGLDSGLNFRWHYNPVFNQGFFDKGIENWSML